MGTGGPQNTGIYEQDNYSNIHDMLGNVREWTTEFSSSSNYPCVDRGGSYDSDSNFVANRVLSTGNTYYIIGFRTQLYIK